MSNTQTEESWDDIFRFLHGATWLDKAAYLAMNYYPPIKKDVIQEKMYSKNDVMRILEHYRSFANSSKGDTTLWYLQTYIKENLK